MGAQELKPYLLEYEGPPAGVAVVLGYGRGHAIKQLAKALEAQDIEWKKSDKARLIEPSNKRGEIFFLSVQKETRN